MILSELPTPVGPRLVDQIEIALDDFSVLALKDQVLNELGVGASTNTQYRVFPPKVRIFYPLIQFRTAAAALKGCTTLAEAHEILAGLKDSDSILKRVKSLKPKPSTVEELAAALPKRDLLSTLGDIIKFASDGDLDGTFVSEVHAQLLSNIGRVGAILREHENIWVASEKGGPKANKKGRARVFFSWKGVPIHHDPTILAWHAQGVKPGGLFGVCIRCGETKQFCKAARARVKGCSPGSGMGATPHHNIAPQSWGVVKGSNDRICVACWAKLDHVFENMGDNAINLQREGLYLSIWAAPGAEEVAEAATSLFTAWGAEDLQDVADSVIWQKGRGPDVERMGAEVRICLWQKQNSTLQILQYWSVPDVQILESLRQFRRRFSQTSINTLIKVTSPGRYQGKWEFTTTTQRQWLNRLFFNTQITRTEAVRAFRTMTSIEQRDLGKDWVYHTIRKIMIDYIKPKKGSAAFQLGALYAVGLQMALSWGPKPTAQKERDEGQAKVQRIFYRKFYKLLQSRPQAGAIRLREHILRLDCQGSLKAYRELRTLWGETCLGVPETLPGHLSQDDRFQFWRGHDHATQAAVMIIQARQRKGFEGKPKGFETPKVKDTPSGVGDLDTLSLN